MTHALGRVKTYSLLATTSLSTLGGSMLNIYISAYLMDMHVSTILLSLYFSIGGISTILFSRFWGFLSDYYGKRKTLVVTFSLLSLIASMGYLFVDDPEKFILVSFVSSVIGMGASPAMFTLISELSSRRGTVFGYFGTMSGIMSTMGMIIGGYVGDHFEKFISVTLALLFNLVAIVVFTAFYKERESATIPFKEALKKAAYDGFNYLNVTKIHILPIIVVGALISLGSGATVTAFRMKTYEMVSEFKSLYGLVYSGGAIGGAISSMLYGRLCDRIGSRKLVMAALSMYIPYLLVLMNVNDWRLFAILWATPISPAISISMQTMISEKTKYNERGAAISTYNMMNSLASITGIMMGGIIITMFHGYVYVLALSIPAIIAALVIAYRIR